MIICKTGDEMVVYVEPRTCMGWRINCFIAEVAVLGSAPKDDD